MDTTGILRPDELPFEVPYDLELAINELLDAWESDEVMNLDCYLNEVQASARSGRSQRPHSAPSGSWNGILRCSTNTVPSMTFLKAVSLLERVPGTRRRDEQASLKKPLIW